MGIIARQGFWNSISQYTGISLAFVNNILLVPWVFSIHPESEWGIVQYLLGVSMILTPLAHLGVPNAIIRFFPYFREKGKAEFFMLVSTIILIGFALTTLGFLAYINIFPPSEPDAGLTQKTLLFVIPMLAGHSMTVVFGSISRAHFNSTIPVMIDQLLLRIVTLVLLILYGFQLVNFAVFLTAYVLTFLAGGVFMLLFIKRFISLKRKSFKYPSRKTIKKVISFVMFSFLSGEASIMFMKLDVIMIKGLLDLESVALYSVPFYMGSMIMAPLRAIIPISFPLISGFWKDNNIEKIKSFYAQTARNQLLISGFVFIVIWLNIDLLLVLLGDKFGSQQAKLVFLFIGIGQLVNACSGNSDQIINASAFYKYLFLFKLMLLSMTILLNFLFIPMFGIKGAAISVLFSLIIYSFAKFILLYRKYKMQPYNFLFFKTLVVFMIPIIINLFLVSFDNLWFLTILRAVIIGATFLYGIYVAGISKEIKDLISLLVKNIIKS